MAAEGPSAVVREGDTVIWDVNGDRQALITVGSESKVKLGKVFCSAAPLVGCPYGSMFALGADGKSLERTEYTPMTDWDLPEEDPRFNTRTNAALVDGGEGHQALSTADIEAMKAEGRAGADIVAALTAHSATFAAKTEFSQEKYKKKKAKKYIQVATVRRPTAATVCEAYFTNSPAKTSYLRVDTLALLLSLANVGAHARVLVVETCGGLLTAAVLERLGPAAGVSGGCVCSAWVGGEGTRKPSLDMWRHFNFPSTQRAALRFAPLVELLGEQRQQAAAEGAEGAGHGAGGATQQQPSAEQQQAAGAEQKKQAEQARQQAAEPQQKEDVQAQQPAAAEGEAGASSVAAAVPGSEAAPMDTQDGAASPPQQQQQEQGGTRMDTAAAGAAALPAKQQQQAPFNCCILAANSVSPLALVRHVLPLLAPSASLAVYNPWAQPLAEAMDALRGQAEMAGLSLHESWWREMQVLPLRTHPTMNMNHGGGFILSGTVLAPQARKQQGQ